MKLGHKGHLNKRNNISKEVFLKSKDFPSDFGRNKKNLTFGGTGRNPPNQGGYSHGFTPRMEVDDEPHPSTQIHGKN
jgi:hypothetical protein